MAVARKCDRCGCYYDTPSTETLSGFQWLKGGVNPTSIIDLCADCCDKLSEWIEGDREKLTEPEPAKIPYEKPVIGDSVEEVTTKGFVSLLEEADEPAEEPDVYHTNADAPGDKEESKPEESGETVTSKPDEPESVTLGREMAKDFFTGMGYKAIAEKHGVNKKKASNCVYAFKRACPNEFAEMSLRANR